MRRFIFFAMTFLLLLGGCSSQSGDFGFKSGNCKEVYKECMSKCTGKGESHDKCTAACSKSEGLCRSMKIKGCMQDCNKKYGKDTPEAESCKNNCKNITE